MIVAAVLSAFLTVAFTVSSLMSYEEKSYELAALYALFAAIFMVITVLL